MPQDPPTITLISGLLSAIAELLWPIIALIAVLVFRQDIRLLLGRLKKGKLLGQEVELESDIERLRGTVQRAQAEAIEASGQRPQLEEHQQTAATTATVAHHSDEEALEDGAVVDKIIGMAANEPLAALLELSQSLERELRVLAVSTALIQGVQRMAPRQIVRLLASRNLLPPHTVESVDQFWEVRNKVIHESINVSRPVLFKVIDLGLQLLRAIRQVPAEVITVFNPGLPVYKDEDCTQEYEEIKGIILHYRSPGTEMTKMWAIRKDADLKKGDYVTKEWDCDRKWEHAWYIDTSSGEKRLAWTGVCEFVGKRVAIL